LKATEKDFAAISTELDGMLKQFETTLLSLAADTGTFHDFSLKKTRRRKSYSQESVRIAIERIPSGHCQNGKQIFCFMKKNSTKH
jgi:hypothetical protein